MKSIINLVATIFAMSVAICLPAVVSAEQKMETVRNLISEDPHRVAQVVKHWVNEGGE